MMDDMRNVVGVTLKTLGQSFNTTDPADPDAGAGKASTA